jgi:hypothetical protein
VSRQKEQESTMTTWNNEERDVTFAEAAPDANPGIDAAYHAKYDRYGAAIVGTVVGDEAAPVTIRVLPRG